MKLLNQVFIARTVPIVLQRRGVNRKAKNDVRQLPKEEFDDYGEKCHLAAVRYVPASDRPHLD